MDKWLFALEFTLSLSKTGKYVGENQALDIIPFEIDMVTLTKKIGHKYMEFGLSAIIPTQLFNIMLRKLT